MEQVLAPVPAEQSDIGKKERHQTLKTDGSVVNKSSG